MFVDVNAKDTFFIPFPDFSTQVNSTSLSSPTGRGHMTAPSLHPSIGPGIGSSLGSPRQLHSPISTLSSPINGMGPPFSVISSPMGAHSMSGPSTPGLGYGTSSPQVSGQGETLLLHTHFIDGNRDMFVTCEGERISLVAFLSTFFFSFLVHFSINTR